MDNSERLSKELAFRNTTYIVKAENSLGTDITIKIGEIPTSLFSAIPLLENWVFLTAWNPLPNILTRDQNMARNQALFTDIKSMHLASINGIGVAKGNKWEEESFFIYNIPVTTAHNLARKYGQLAFVYGYAHQPAELIFTELS